MFSFSAARGTPSYSMTNAEQIKRIKTEGGKGYISDLNSISTSAGLLGLKVSMITSSRALKVKFTSEEEADKTKNLPHYHILSGTIKGKPREGTRSQLEGK